MATDTGVVSHFRGTIMVDFEKDRDLRMWIMEHTGGPAAGGLTVRDVMATTAMGVILEIEYKQYLNTVMEMDEYGVAECDFNEVAEIAYCVADAMLEARVPPPPKKECSVEEAFGL